MTIRIVRLGTPRAADEGTRIGTALSAPLPKDGARLVRGLRWQMAAPVAQ